MEDEEIRVGRQTLQITRPEKVLFPRDGINKGELADYYLRIAPFMLPHIHDRPLALERYPDGIGEEGFFQKESGRYFPKWIKTVALAKQGGSVNHVICNDAATLVYLAGQAVITPHMWLSHADRPDYPDRMIFDFDPSGREFERVCAAAISLRKMLADLRLPACPMLTGSRGLHVIVPLDGRKGFDQVRLFAQAIAQRLVESDPEHLTTAMQKNRRGGRIFVDTGRNSYAQTAVAPYAVRARAGAPVATPLQWDELEDANLRANRYNVTSIFERLKKVGDPLLGLREIHRRIAA